ncbi:MAG: hypothetical protein SGI74_10110 [Oligoflexia bacterium]|nr:hypothetical protein [Oligoflexia bacterium]
MNKFNSRLSPISALVLVLGLIINTANAQETNTQTFDVDDSGTSSHHATRLSMDIVSATAAPPESISFTSYAFGIEQDLGKRVTLMGKLPLISGNAIVRNEIGEKKFNELGNPFLGAYLQLLQLQEYHPLWLSVHGGVRFSRPEKETIAAARYQEYHTGLSLTKYFDSVAVITQATYIQKVDEAEAGLNVGNQLDGYGGLRINIDEDWVVQGGYVVKHADPLRYMNEVIVKDCLYTAADLQVTFHLSPIMDLVGRFAIPLASQQSYGAAQAAFGDLTTQASLGRSWSLGVNVGL